MSMRAPTKAGYEPIVGYTLRKRLGAGGYGEVWLADAPGGLQKAIKLIYGTVDQAHATSELRSLQRIRQVYHPFLLSIERIEIIDNQVVIVTELAESSLLDRFEQCRRKGAQGIDRGQLLDFMRDAADALDFLAQKHSLQHLDVKPGNLLIIADRIKVADFGLIKDLHDQNQSLVSGLTPTYSAPEIFDGRPDYRSDQYSLAIVYMEMLSGQLPFPGKSTGELARQHLTMAPDLESLPPADRPIVARGLAKNPLDRFGSCRLFIEQLLKTRGAVLPVTQLKSTPSVGEATEIVSTSAEEGQTATAVSLVSRQSVQPAIDVRPLCKSWVNPRAMFVGLGGLGGQSLVNIRQMANRDCDNRLDIDDHAWSAIDTDAESLNAITTETLDGHLQGRHAFEMRLFNPSEYRDAEPDLFGPLSRRWLYNIPRSLKTEGVRPLATLALLDHYMQLRSRLAADLRELIAKHERDEECEEPLRIYVLSSLHGGTGSALLAEIGFLIRRITGELGFTHYRLCALAAAATTTHNNTANLHSAAGIATLSELAYAMDGQNEISSIHFRDTLHAVASARPFDWVTLVDGGLHGNRNDCESACRELASAAWLDSQSLIGAALNQNRSDASAHFQNWLRTSACSPMGIATCGTAAALARWCCEQTLIHASEYMSRPRGLATADNGNDSATPDGTPTVSGDFPLTNQASGDIATRWMNELGFLTTQGSFSGEAGKVLIADWGRRLSDEKPVSAAQLASDVNVWKHSVAKIFKLRVYNWKQIEQVQLNAIEKVIEFYEQNATQLTRLLQAEQPKLLAQPERVVAYLRRFSEACMRLLQDFQQEGRRLAIRVRSWCDSISAEKSLNEASSDVNLSGLPPKIQLLVNRVNAVLESTVHSLAMQRVGFGDRSAKHYEMHYDESEVATAGFNLKYMLSLSNDVLTRIANEMGITADEFETSGEQNAAAVSFKQIGSFVPALTQGGAKLHRFLVAPVEQEQLALTALKKVRLESKTTLIGGRRSLESHLFCEAYDLKLHQLVSSLWRPCNKTLQLAERLRTRVDVDWHSVNKLLEVPDSELPGDSLKVVEQVSVIAPLTATPSVLCDNLPILN